MWVRDASLVDVKNASEPVVLPTNSGVSGYGLTPTVPRVLESAGPLGNIGMRWIDVDARRIELRDIQQGVELRMSLVNGQQ